MATGRTVSKFFKLQIDDSGGTLRDIPTSTIGEVGLEYPEVDVTAWQDAIMGVLLDIPTFTVDIGGPFSDAVVQAASASGAVAALSGSHTVLAGVNGSITPLTFGFYFGIQAVWATGAPAFGITATATSGGVISSYKVTADGASYTAKLSMFTGSAAPAWGTAAFT